MTFDLLKLSKFILVKTFKYTLLCECHTDIEIQPHVLYTPYIISLAQEHKKSYSNTNMFRTLRNENIIGPELMGKKKTTEYQIGFNESKGNR